IKKNFALLRLDEAVEMLIRGAAPDNAVSVTFDDGYEDNYTNACPLLRRYGIPAAFFLSVHAIDQGRLLWFDEITEGVRRSEAARLDLRGAGLGDYPLGSSGEKRAAAQDAVQYAKGLVPAGRERFIGEVLRRLGFDRAALADRKMMMTWDNVNEMKKYGFYFGSHGMNHEIFSRLTKEEMEYEVLQSRRIIRERTGIKVTAFAYPNGGAGDFTVAAEEVLANAGFRAVCTL
ncbi:MAG: polysaccharide deacetylase family protein, partial [Endomicrobiales bacterium]